jgi:molybdopterin converting factor small subunit
MTEITEMQNEIATLKAQIEADRKAHEKALAAAGQTEQRLKDRMSEQRSRIEALKAERDQALTASEPAETAADRIFARLAKMEMLAEQAKEISRGSNGDHGLEDRDHPSIVALRFALSRVPLAVMQGINDRVWNGKTYYGSESHLAYCQRQWDSIGNNPNATADQVAQAKVNLYIAQLRHRTLTEMLDLIGDIYHRASGETVEELVAKIGGRRRATDAEPRAAERIANIDAIMNG